VPLVHVQFVHHEPGLFNTCQLLQYLTEVTSTLIWLGSGRRTTTDRVLGIVDTRGYGTDGGIRDTIEVVTEPIRHHLASMTLWESQVKYRLHSGTRLFERTIGGMCAHTST
jgi:hypothetical protein